MVVAIVDYGIIAILQLGSRKSFHKFCQFLPFYRFLVGVPPGIYFLETGIQFESLEVIAQLPCQVFLSDLILSSLSLRPFNRDCSETSVKVLVLLSVEHIGKDQQLLALFEYFDELSVIVGFHVRHFPLPQ